MDLINQLKDNHKTPGQIKKMVEKKLMRKQRQLQKEKKKFSRYFSDDEEEEEKEKEISERTQQLKQKRTVQQLALGLETCIKEDEKKRESFFLEFEQGISHARKNAKKQREKQQKYEEKEEMMENERIFQKFKKCLENPEYFIDTFKSERKKYKRICGKDKLLLDKYLFGWLEDFITAMETDDRVNIEDKKKDEFVNLIEKIKQTMCTQNIGSNTDHLSSSTMSQPESEKEKEHESSLSSTLKRARNENEEKKQVVQKDEKSENETKVTKTPDLKTRCMRHYKSRCLICK